MDRAMEDVVVAHVVDRAHFPLPAFARTHALLCAPVDGAVAFEAHGERVTIAPGEAALVKPLGEGVTPLVRVLGARGPAHVLFVGARGDLAEQEASAQRPRAVRLSTDAMRAHGLDALRDALLASLGDPSARTHLAAALVLMAGRMAAPREARDPQIDAAIAFLRANPTRALSVAALGKRVGLSRAAFARRFLAATGKTPARYLTEHRLALAIARMRDTDDGLAHIAVDVGYANEFAFGRAFKRVYGESPGRYRRHLHGAAPITMRLAA